MRLFALLALAVLTTGTAFSQRGSVDPVTKAALLASLDMERRTEAGYRAVIRTFGPLTPFTNIVKAEATHQQAVLKMMKQYGIVAPQNPYINYQFILPDTFQAVCAEAAVAERKDAIFYAQMAETVREQNVVRLFTQLQQVNVENHAEAFDRAAAGDCGWQTCTGDCQGQGEGVCDATSKGKRHALGNGNGAGDGVCDGTGKGNGGGKGKGGRK